VASGSYRMAAIQAAFRRAARRLEHLASRHYSTNGGNGSSSASGSSSSGRSSERINYLEGLFNVQAALSRRGDGRRLGRLSDRGMGLLEGGGLVADEYYVVQQQHSGGGGGRVRALCGVLILNMGLVCCWECRVGWWRAPGARPQPSHASVAPVTWRRVCVLQCSCSSASSPAGPTTTLPP
jgi:hypothetical protein